MICLWNAGSYLNYNQAPIKADVIIVCAGDRGARTERGIELYRNNYADYIIMSGGKLYYRYTIADLMKNHAIELGVPENNIIVEDQADDTYQNAKLTKALLEQKGFKSAIVVSSNYHMRRVKLMFDRVYQGSGIHLTYCSADDPGYNPQRWWIGLSSIISTVSEYVKIIRCEVMPAYRS